MAKCLRFQRDYKSQQASGTDLEGTSESLLQASFPIKYLSYPPVTKKKIVSGSTYCIPKSEIETINCNCTKAKYFYLFSS